MSLKDKAQSEAPSVDDVVNSIFLKLTMWVKKQTDEDPHVYAKAKINRLIVEARIDELKRLDATASRTYTQKVTDKDGGVYVDDSHTYISRYETQERIAELSNNLSKGKDNE